jgi:hypothetical protein
MTLKPIPGAPIDAPIPDFPTGEPGPLVVPASPLTRRSVEPPPPALSPVRQPGPIEIRGDGDTILTFRVVPEVPAINRASMTISLTGDPGMMSQLDLATDEAKTFLQALRDGPWPIVVANGRAAFLLEFAITEDGPVFTISKPGQQHTARRFSVGWGYDVEALATRLLADLGP